ncbi:hypothetical protein F909_01308 [Acinetobacter sp. ANC 3929]|uniref:Uncharacterized protein n=2 Tax=Acinetobacter TaxID=469 RepID=S3TZN1_9GAMM|nr:MULTISPECIES: hypothetical protein [Acinetobacter]ENW82231.1 hypothetical protein F909_01308 [Acinetobacter sp. ANC 3929]ENX58697.1 hypothetical protein F902_01321 [Acinetobacter higginsii]EPG41090.1 hypothetical protein F907_00653 [Acinetobacter colistiniresistens]
MKDVHPLFVCVLGSFLLIGCGNKNSSTEVLSPDENVALSQRLEPTHRPVLVEAKALQPFLNQQQLPEADVSGFRDYLHAQSGNRSALLQFREKLQLKPNQILVLGIEKPSQQSLLEFPKNDLFASANDLVINHARMLKTPVTGESKGEFETTEQYQQRIQAEQATLKKATANLNVDLGRLEDALNYLAYPIAINVLSPSSEDSAQYDADRQVMHIQASSTNAAGYYDSTVSKLNLVFSASPKNAEIILGNLRDERDKRNYLGFILSMQQGQLVLEQAILYQHNNNDRYLRLATINPSQLYLTTRPLNADESNKNLNSEQPYSLKQKLSFQFGLKHYRNPEQQQAEPELEVRPPTEEEITQLNLNAGSSDIEGTL